VNLIVAVTADWGIGCENRLLYRISEDMRRFKEMTIGKVVVMGHNTFKSLPDGLPLPERANIMLSANPGLCIPGVTVCESVAKLHDVLESYATEDVFVIGGESVYVQLLNSCENAYITKIERTPMADTFFPNLDELPGWWLAEESETKVSKTGIQFRFCEYVKI